MCQAFRTHIAYRVCKNPPVGKGVQRDIDLLTPEEVDQTPGGILANGPGKPLPRPARVPCRDRDFLATEGVRHGNGSVGPDLLGDRAKNVIFRCPVIAHDARYHSRVMVICGAGLASSSPQASRSP